jgi:uncharacterized protein YacL
MESSPRSRSGEMSGRIPIILVTLAQLIFFTRFHKYIAWHTAQPDGSVTRLSMLTDDYFIWLPIMITASIIVIIASVAMIIYDKYRFRKTTEISFSIIGIVVSVSLVSIFPFDFSVIPNATAVDVVPIVVTVFFILMAVFYGITAIVMFVKFRSHVAKQETK